MARQKNRFCVQCGYPKEPSFTHLSPPPGSYFPDVKLCSGCERVWYCSKPCQERDWAHHVLFCHPLTGIIDNVYVLAQAVRLDEIPQDPDVLIEYKFARAFSPEGMKNLFDIYSMMLSVLDVLPQTLREWRRRGGAWMMEKIVQTFNRPFSHELYFYDHWLKAYPYIFDDSGSSCGSRDYRIVGMKWAGMFVPKTPNELDRLVLKMPDDVRALLWFCSMLLSDTQWIPTRESYAYLELGFCACRTVDGEKSLGDRWRRVLSRSSFKDVFHAYLNSSLYALFELKGEPLDDHCVEDVLHASPHHQKLKPVWYLKQRVTCDKTLVRLAGQSSSNLRRIIERTFGYRNCNPDIELDDDAPERRKLSAMYERLFEFVDPLELHEASLDNGLYDLVTRYIHFEDDEEAKLFLRLLDVERMEEAEWEEEEEEGYEGESSYGEYCQRSGDPYDDENYGPFFN